MAKLTGICFYFAAFGCAQLAAGFSQVKHISPVSVLGGPSMPCDSSFGPNKCCKWTLDPYFGCDFDSSESCLGWAAPLGSSGFTLVSNMSALAPPVSSHKGSVFGVAVCPNAKLKRRPSAIRQTLPNSSGYMELSFWYYLNRSNGSRASVAVSLVHARTLQEITVKTYNESLAKWIPVSIKFKQTNGSHPTVLQISALAADSCQDIVALDTINVAKMTLTQESACPPMSHAKRNSDYPTVKIRVIEFSTSENCDPWYSFAPKCDPFFAITYSWHGGSEVQYYGTSDDVNVVSFPSSVGKDVIVPKGSTVQVEIVAKDEDFEYDDTIGTFSFSYSVPQSPSGLSSQLQTSTSRNAFMRVKFDTFF